MECLKGKNMEMNPPEKREIDELNKKINEEEFLQNGKELLTEVAVNLARLEENPDPNVLSEKIKKLGDKLDSAEAKLSGSELDKEINPYDKKSIEDLRKRIESLEK